MTIFQRDDGGKFAVGSQAIATARVAASNKPLAGDVQCAIIPMSRTHWVKQMMNAMRPSLIATILAIAFWQAAVPTFAQGGERGKPVYYSIHLASFKSLQNANRQVNTLKTKGKVVFWKKTDVPGKGIFYRVYLGKYTDRDVAVAFWKTLKDEGAVSYFGVHEFSPPAASKMPEVRPGEITAEREPAVASRPLPKAPGERFVDNGDGTITDTRHGLMWIKNGWRLDFVSATPFREAVKLCEMFAFAGYNDWRLPKIREWLGIIDRKNQYPALASPNPFVNIIAHMPYWSSTEYAYGIHGTPGKGPAPETYTVLLYAGTVHHQKKTERAFVMPVRSLED